MFTRLQMLGRRYEIALWRAELREGDIAEDRVNDEFEQWNRSQSCMISGYTSCRLWKITRNDRACEETFAGAVRLRKLLKSRRSEICLASASILQFVRPPNYTCYKQHEPLL